MTVKLVGLAAQPGTFHNKPLQTTHHCIIDPSNSAYLIQPRPKREPAGEEILAFDYPDVETPPSPTSRTRAEIQALLKEALRKRPKPKLRRA
jgi:hypothetical protein